MKTVERKAEADRGQWTYKIDYMLSMIGFSVGLGNLWRFPYVCMLNGGGAFLIPFVTCLILCGLPLFVLETTVGQFTGKGTTHIGEACPLLKGLGVTMIILLNIFSICYNMIIGWILYYLANSFISPLPWTSCNNTWNTLNCIEHSVTNIQHPIFNSSKIFNESIVYQHSVIENTSSNDVAVNINRNGSESEHEFTALEEFWSHNVLEMSTGIGEIGNINVHLLACLAAASCIVCLCIIKGVKSVGKVVYVTAVLPYILLTILLIRGLTLDGATDGLMFYLKPDFSKLLNFQVWITAAIQVFYSLGAASGALIAMGSFNKFNNNCLRDSVILTFICEGTSVYAGFVIFAVLGYLAKLSSVPVDSIVKSGPGLAFVAYPEALARMPGQQLWSVLFFLMLLTISLDTVFAGAETIVVAFSDTWPILRRHKVSVAVVYCVVQFLCGVIFCTQGGIYIFQLFDWYAAFSMSFLGLLECILFGWIYGVDRLSKDLKMMIGRELPIFLKICIRFITPGILSVLFIIGIAKYKPPTLGNYRYPDVAVVFGFIIALGPLVPIPLYAVKFITSAPGATLKERLLYSFRPTEQWRPADTEQCLSYDNGKPSHKGTLTERINLVSKETDKSDKL